MLRNNKPNKMPRDLAKAVRANDVELVKSILADEKYRDTAWLNAVNRRGRTALQLALKYKCFDVAAILLTYAGIDLTVVDKYGYTLLDLSVGNAGIFLRILNDTNAPVLTSSATRVAAVMLSINDNRLDLFKALIAKGINIDAAVYDDNTILKCAVVRGRTEFVRFLLEQRGINVNTAHPLVEAAFNQHVEILTLLVNHPGINVNLGNGVNRPIDALHFMHNLHGNPDARGLQCLKVLLSHPDIDKQWFNECDAFMKWLLMVSPALFRKIINLPSTRIVSEYYNRNNKRYFDITCNLADAITVLISDPDFDINRLTWDGRTLLTRAIEQRNDGIVNALLDCPRIDLHLQDTFRHTALTQAAESGRKGLVATIMQHPRFDILAKYKYQQNLLMLAVQMDCAHLVRLLLQANYFDVNAADTNGNTALILLARYHKHENDATLFTELMGHGADPTQKNNKGINAIMAAKNRGLKGIAHELKTAVPRAVGHQHHEATAPRLAELDLQDSLVSAANQPPSGYYRQGLFAPEVQAQVQPAPSIEHQSTLTRTNL